MKLRELLAELSACDHDAEVVMQLNYGDGCFDLFEPIVWPDGHSGHNGPILVIGLSVETESEAT